MVLLLSDDVLTAESALAAAVDLTPNFHLINLESCIGCCQIAKVALQQELASMGPLPSKSCLSPSYLGCMLSPSSRLGCSYLATIICMVFQYIMSALRISLQEEHS